jgi:hypothetical protein
VHVRGYSLSRWSFHFNATPLRLIPAGLERSGERGERAGRGTPRRGSTARGPRARGRGAGRAADPHMPTPPTYRYRCDVPRHVATYPGRTPPGPGSALSTLSAPGPGPGRAAADPVTGAVHGRS